MIAVRRLNKQRFDVLTIPEGYRHGQKGKSYTIKPNWQHEKRGQPLLPDTFPIPKFLSSNAFDIVRSNNSNKLTLSGHLSSGLSLWFIMGELVVFIRLKVVARVAI